MFTQFYNEALRKLVIGFGSLFNDIRVVRKNEDGTTKENIRIPLSYGPKEKFIRRISEMSSITSTTRTEIILPRMGFDITGMVYDSARKGNKLRVTRNVTSDSASSWNYSEVPYNINFGLYSFTRNQDENLQVIEQILPYFSPEFIVTFKLNSINDKIDIPIILNGVSTVEDYEGDFDTRRSIITTFDFVAKSYVFGPSRTGKVITQAQVDFFGAEKFHVSVDGDHDATVGITGGFTGEGYTAGNRIYGDYYYE